MDTTNILTLLDQLIEEEKKRDAIFKAKMYAEHKARQATGDSFTLYHLKVLKDLIIEEDKKDKERLTQSTVGWTPGTWVDTGVFPLTGQWKVDNGWTGSPETHPGIPCIVSRPVEGFNGTTFVSPQQEFRGCVGNRYCFKCNTNWFSSCICLPVCCPRCGGEPMPSYRDGIKDIDVSNFKSEHYDSFKPRHPDCNKPTNYLDYHISQGGLNHFQILTT